jgi:hypothetical protein
MIKQHMSLSHEKAEWSVSIWVCHMRMGIDHSAWVNFCNTRTRKLNNQTAYEFVTWESWMIRQHMSLSCEKAEGSGSMWVCHMRKLNNQAAWVCHMRMGIDHAAYELIFVTLSHKKAEWSGSIWVCHMRKLNNQAAYEFVTWESWMMRQHMSFSHEKAEWSGSIWGFFFSIVTRES